MSIQHKRDIFLDALSRKALMKQDVIEKSKESFLLFKNILQEEIEAMFSKITDARLRMYFTPKGEFECVSFIGSDALVFHLHTNVFSLPEGHPLWEMDYIKEDTDRAFFGIINVYNFIAQSVLKNKLEDVGEIIARIFINKDGYFFMEGVEHVAEKYQVLGQHKFNKVNIRSIVYLLFETAISVDLTIPPYDSVSELTVMHLNEISVDLGLKTRKSVGFVNKKSDSIEF